MLEIGGEHVDLLCDNRWLPQGPDTYTREQIRCALQKMIDNAAGTPLLGEQLVAEFEFLLGPTQLTI
jgi:hypothetical protein